MVISEGHQRTVLQFLLLERMMPYSEFSELVCRVVGTDSRIDTLVETLNEKIRRFSQKILTANSESTGEKIVVLASTADTVEIKGTLTKDQMDYFYHLMDDIIGNQGNIALNAALNSAPFQTSGRISISEAEKLLDHLIKKKLLVSENGYIFLSPLTIVELGSYITENYKPENCMLCKKMVIAGGPCPHCQAMVHSPCAKAYVTSTRQSRCPQCRGDW